MYIYICTCIHTYIYTYICMHTQVKEGTRYKPKLGIAHVAALNMRIMTVRGAARPPPAPSPKTMNRFRAQSW